MDDSDARPGTAGRRFATLEWVSETGSTNADLAAAARRGGPEQVLVADHQTAGRGRLDRRWEAPPDTSVLMSVLVRPAVPAERFPLVTVCMALAVRSVLGDRRAPVGVKWPNDVIELGVDDPAAVHKVAGVLSEAVWADDGTAAVVVGVGINVNWPDGFPSHLAEGATSLNRLIGTSVDRRELVDDLLDAFAAEVDDLETDGGAARLVERARAVLVTLGRTVRVETPTGAVIGRAVDVTEEGALVIDTDAGRREVTTGDIVHLRPAPEPGGPDQSP